MESIVTALIGQPVGRSVYKYLGDCPLVFSNCCMNLGHHKGTKVTEPDF